MSNERMRVLAMMKEEKDRIQIRMDKLRQVDRDLIEQDLKDYCYRLVKVKNGIYTYKK